MLQTHEPITPDSQVSKLVRRHAIPYTGEKKELDSLITLIGDSSFVLIGEASHGTHEFYKTRIELTKRLIEEKGFNAIAAEADWPDAIRVNRYVVGESEEPNAVSALSGFQRFPTWLWRNADVLSFIEWLTSYNKDFSHEQRVGFYGLDLYSLYRSIEAIINYLEPIDPEAADKAREKYSCLSAYGYDEQTYGYAASLGLARECEENILNQLAELQNKELDYLKKDGRKARDEFFYAEQNAILVAHAQAYYREMFRGRMSTWNLRDSHMMKTLLNLRDHMKRAGRHMKVVVWAHNSHLGDARATEMSHRGELNLGQLVRQHLGDRCCLIGFSCYSGTVTAASTWGGPAERKTVRPGLTGSFERLFHGVDLPSFILPFRTTGLNNGLKHPRLQRAIGVLYVPETERYSHYFFSTLPKQFDAVIHFQETQAVEPLERNALWVEGETRIEDLVD
ncbi:MAG: erythromycin esterase [Cyanobacteria bacterium PR.3.49]|jgi:erythromycin esterase-like protein|nr:erythromycin esterase [Cyanobacteria bacterium PR.3.49]